MKFNLFSYGFRPGFLFAGIAAVLLVPLWAMSFVSGTPLGSSWPPTLWHGHEMLFGFLGSAVAGFLLTAVPSWTGQKGVSGRPLVVLASVWLAARLLIATSGWWPAPLIAAVDLSFLPVLAFLVAGPLLRPRNRNAVLLLVLGVLWFTDLIFHVALIRKNPVLADHALNIGIDVLLTLVTVIGGRIVPAFTAAALRQQGRPGSGAIATRVDGLRNRRHGACHARRHFLAGHPCCRRRRGIAAIVQGVRWCSGELCARCVNPLSGSYISRMRGSRSASR